MAEFPDRRPELLKILKDLTSQREDSPQVRYRSLSIPALAGSPDLLKETARELRASGNAGFRFWGMAEAVRFLAEENQTEKMLMRNRRCFGAPNSAWPVMPLACTRSRVATGPRHAERFAECVNTGCYLYFEYAWAKAFLARMDRDEKWPDWIRVIWGRPRSHPIGPLWMSL